MKIVSYLTLLFLSVLIFSSCKDTRTYARQLKAEKVLIEDYIKRNGIKLVDKLPADSVFLNDEKIYYKSTSGLYYRLENGGDSSKDTIASGDKLKIGTKYLEYTLDVNADTADYWSPNLSSGWREFTYGSSGNQVATAFLEAVGYMKKTEAEAKLIVPSKLGFTYSEVTPYGYKMKIRFTKNNIPSD